MPKKIEFDKLSKDELVKRIGSKLKKDELAQLAEGLHTGNLSPDSFVWGDRANA